MSKSPARPQDRRPNTCTSSQISLNVLAASIIRDPVQSPALSVNSFAKLPNPARRRIEQPSEQWLNTETTQHTTYARREQI